MSTSRDFRQNEEPSTGEVVIPTEDGQDVIGQVPNICNPICRMSVLEGASNLTVDKDVSDYVWIPALEEADEILHSTGLVILCGPPGCGKTTLAYALSRRSRREGFSVYILDHVSKWKSKVGEQERSIVVLDENFGKVCLDSQQHSYWKKNLNTVLEMIRHGRCRLVITVYPHILHELQQLETHLDSPLRDECAVVKLTKSLPTDVRKHLLNFHLDKLSLESDRQCQIVKTVVDNDESGPVFPWCCAYMIKNWLPSENPTSIFLRPAEAHALLFKEMVLDKTYGTIFVAVLVLTMKGVFHFLHNLSETAPNLQKLGLPNIDADTLTRYADILQGTILFRGTFTSRVLYEAAGLALGRSFHLPTLLKVCDIPFLVKFVQLTVSEQTMSAGLSFNQCVTVGAVPSCLSDPKCCTVDHQALMERIYTDIIKGNLQDISQHPCLQCPDFLQDLDRYCLEDRKRMKQLLSAVDPVHHLPLVYWSAFLPSPSLTHWCLARVETFGQVSAVVLMASSLFDHVMQTSQSRLQSVLSEMVTAKLFNHPDCIMDFPFPGQCLTKEVQKLKELIHGAESIQGRLLYLLDPSLPIPPDLLTIQVTGDRLQLQVKDRRLWYLVFRLLTDRVVCETDKDGDSLLHVAVNNGKRGAGRLCLKAGALITQKNRKGVTPYQLADKTRAQAAKDRKQSDTDHIFRCIQRADEREVQFHLLYEIGVHDSNSDGRTVLAMVCGERREDVADIVSLLVQAGADINAKSFQGVTPLLWAVRYGQTDTVRALIYHGADVNAQNKHGNTPLLWAVMYGQVDTVRALIDHEADVNAQNKDGNTPLLLAARYGQTDTVRALADHGADVNAKDKDGNTPLLLAARYGQTDTVRALADHGADVNAKDKDGNTPLLLAVRHGQTDRVRALTEHGADVNAQDKNGYTPLQLAVRYGQTDTIRALTEHGADVNAQDKDGNALLLWAVRHGQTDTVRALTDLGADVNAQDKDGNTPLLLAVRYGQTDTIRALKGLEADVSTQNKYGDTPLQ